MKKPGANAPGPYLQNRTAAEDGISLIKYHGLSRRDGPLGHIEADLCAALRRDRHRARLLRLAVAGLGAAWKLPGRRIPRDPVQVPGCQRPGI